MSPWVCCLFLLDLTIFAASQEFPSACAPQKCVLDHGIYTYYNVTEKLSERYGCLDDCVYVKEGTEDKYCFAPGPYRVTCDGIPFVTLNYIY